MGRRRLEGHAKNVRKKTTEGVGSASRWLRESRRARFLDANSLHIARAVELPARWRQLLSGVGGLKVFLLWRPRRGTAKAGFRILWRVGWPQATARLRVYSQQRRTISATGFGQAGCSC